MPDFSHAAAIKALRTRAKLTQSALAKLCEVESMQVSRWERGQNVPPPEMLGRIAEACQLPLVIRYEP